MRERLKCGHGRRRRPVGRSPRPRSVPAALQSRPALVAADRGRGATHGDGDRARRRLGAPRRGRSGGDEPGRRRRLPRPRPVRRRQPPGHPSAGRDPAGTGVRRPSPRRRSARRELWLRRAHVGQHRRRHDGDADRHLPARGRGQSAPAARLTAIGRAPRAGLGQPRDPAARCRDRQRRAGAGSGARPPPRPPSDRGPTRLVRQAGRQRTATGTAPRAMPWSGTRCA